MSIVITSKITLGSQQFQVVGEDESLRKPCKFGSKTRILIFSQEHVQVLSTKIKTLQESGGSEDEITRLQKELEFINKHNEIHAAQVLALDDYDTTLTRTDTQTSTLSEGENFHVSAETFGKLKNLKLIKVKDKREKLLRVPKVRQYIINGVLHREVDEMKVTWYELFVDLVYIAIVFKSSHLISSGGYNWTAFFHLFLVYSPIFSHWSSFSMYNNMFYHDDLYYKIFCYFMTSTLVIMSVSVGNAFNEVDADNTAGIFLTGFLLSKLALLLSFSYLYYHMPDFRHALAKFYFFGQVLPAVLYIPAIFMKGDDKLVMWTVAAIVPFIAPAFSVLLPFPPKVKRMAVNIEHITERLGLLVVIVLGEIVFAFLFDHPSASYADDIGLVLASFLTTSNLFYLYFRSETEPKYQHAIRRNVVTGFMWNMMHFPLSLMLSTTGACLSGILKSEIPKYPGQTPLKVIDLGFSKAAASSDKSPVFGMEFRSLFTTAVGLVHICLAIMQLLHQEEGEGQRKRRRIHNISQKTRIYGRALIGLTIILIGNLAQFSGKSWLLIITAITTFEVVGEEYGRIRGKINNGELDLSVDMIQVNRE